MFKKPNKVLLSVLPIFILPLAVSCSKEKATETATQVPVLTTAAVTGITQMTAQCGGTITSDGGANVFYRGVCWSTNPTPTYSDMKTYDGTGTGTFTSSLAGLTAMTHYYVRAYAMNDAGLGYGIVDSFFTTDSTGTVTDFDGNIYLTIKIGTQWWMAENLKVTHYRNGGAIPNVTDYSSWENLASGAYCNYNNDTTHVAVSGRLYNWFAVSDSHNIAPAGWHVPTDAEWKQMEMHLGMSQGEADSTGYRGTDTGGQMKETGTTYWHSPNTGATNESGFSALPCGYRHTDGYYYDIGFSAFFWSSTQSDVGNAWYRYLYHDNSGVARYGNFLTIGFSVRCVKD